MTPFNTVVLFDVENLLGPRKGWAEAATRLSFGDILAQLRSDDSDTIGRFAVSRAYANWGKDYMEALRREMTENGIEPRQIYGFDPAGLKNAADIELVIDAMDLAYLRPEIATFVLVTRDGGFAALARKLHELGKSVVVCGAADVSGALRSVADVFIELPQPDEGPVAVAEDPHRADAAARERKLDETRRKVLDEIATLLRGDGRLETDGIPLTELGQRFRLAIPSLVEDRSGYLGLREFLQWALVGSEYAVIRRVGDGPEGSKVRLGRRSLAPRGFEQLPNLGKQLPRNLKDLATLYRFHASNGRPSIRLAEPRSIALVLDEVARSRRPDEELPTLINRTAEALAGTVPAEDVKFTLLALTRVDGSAGKSARELRASLLATVRKKLETRLDKVDDAVLESLID